MESAKNVKWVIPLKKFGMVRVQALILTSLKLIMDSSNNDRWIIHFKKFRRLKMCVFKFVLDISMGESEKSLSASLLIYTETFFALTYRFVVVKDKYCCVKTSTHSFLEESVLLSLICFSQLLGGVKLQRIIGWCRGWKSLSDKAEEFIR